MTHHAQIDVEWGGENVYVRTNTDAIQVQAFLTDADADTMRTQLGWAVGEVRRFRQHLANEGRAALFDGRPKPGCAAEEEADHLRADVARLTRERDEARAEAQRAWDASRNNALCYDEMLEVKAAREATIAELERRLASRPAIPADAEDLAWSACMDDDKFCSLNSGEILEVIRRTLKAIASAAPVSGSDCEATR
jgi:hypothetical protein